MIEIVNRVNWPKPRLNSQGNENKEEKELFIFIHFIFILNREISTCMVSPFFSTDVFWSFYPQDYIYILFI